MRRIVFDYVVDGCSFLFFSSHTISSEDTCFNDILSRCQVKKSLNPDANMSIAYGAERSISSLKRNLSSISAEGDMKLTTSN